MKVFIGKYRSWVGPFQIANWLQKVGVSEDRCHKIGEKLSKTWLMKFCEWVEQKKKRNIKIKIHNYDTWSMDHTLAVIILPMLKQLKATSHGVPNTDDEDVPEGINLRESEAPEHEKWDVDDNIEKRWEWILNEMIWAFEQLNSDDGDNASQFFDHSECEGLSFVDSIGKVKVDQEGLKKHEDRIKNGLRLFGKYYQSLWD